MDGVEKACFQPVERADHQSITKQGRSHVFIFVFRTGGHVFGRQSVQRVPSAQRLGRFLRCSAENRHRIGKDGHAAVVEIGKTCADDIAARFVMFKHGEYAQ